MIKYQFSYSERLLIASSIGTIDASTMQTPTKHLSLGGALLEGNKSELNPVFQIIWHPPLLERQKRRFGRGDVQ